MMDFEAAEVIDARQGMPLVQRWVEWTGGRLTATFRSVRVTRLLDGKIGPISGGQLP